MRRTYAYNGIIIGMLLGLGAWAMTGSGVAGIAVAVVGSVVSFLAIRGIENALYKGAEKAGEAINRKLDEAHRKKTQA